MRDGSENSPETTTCRCQKVLHPKTHNQGKRSVFWSTNDLIRRVQGSRKTFNQVPTAPRCICATLLLHLCLFHVGDTAESNSECDLWVPEDYDYRLIVQRLVEEVEESAIYVHERDSAAVAGPTDGSIVKNLDISLFGNGSLHANERLSFSSEENRSRSSVCLMSHWKLETVFFTGQQSKVPRVFPIQYQRTESAAQRR